MIFHANVNKKKVGVAIFMSDKVDFKTKGTIKDKKNYIMIKASIQEQDTTIHKYICT